MPFSLLIFVVVSIVAVVAFVNTSPRVANRGPLLAYNAVTLALSIPVAITVGFWIFQDAVALRSGENAMAAYLGVMAGGAAALVVVAIGGLVRNFAVYPHSRRLAPPPDGNS